MGQTTPFPVASNKKPTISLEERLAGVEIPANIGTFSPDEKKPLSSSGWISSYQEPKRVGGNEIMQRSSGVELPAFDIDTVRKLRQMGFTPENILAFLELQKKQIIGENPSLTIEGVKSSQKEGLTNETTNDSTPNSLLQKETTPVQKADFSFKKYALAKPRLITKPPQIEVEKPVATKTVTEKEIPLPPQEQEIVATKIQTSQTPPEETISSPSQPVETLPPIIESAPSQEDISSIKTIEANISPDPSKIAKRRDSVEKLLKAFDSHGSKKWTDYITPLHTNALDAQKRVLSWRNSLDDVPSSFLSTVIDTATENLPEEWNKFSAHEVIASDQPVAGIPSDTIRLEIAMTVKYLGTLDQAADAAQIIKKYKGDTFSTYQEYLAGNPSLSIRSYYNEVRERILKADATENKISMPDFASLYTKLINDFNLQELPEIDREDVLLGVSKTIQKQFLLDVFELVGEERFTALLTSKNMGEEFYATTLKHLLPAYEEIFQASRMKVVTAFNKQGAGSSL